MLLIIMKKRDELRTLHMAKRKSNVGISQKKRTRNKIRKKKERIRKK